MSFENDGLKQLSAEHNLRLYTFDSIDSTNSESARRIANGESRFLVLSASQTAGRGRRGHSFFSPRGSGIYMSLAQPVKDELTELDGLTAYAAVCVAQAVKQLAGLECGIKWVNDIFYRGKKVGGILCETAPLPDGKMCVITGIGINISEFSMPSELANIAGSLNLPEEYALPLAAEVTDTLLRFDPLNRAFMDEYRRRSIVLGHRVSYISNDHEYNGTAESIDNKGRLIVRLSNGATQVLTSGEISLHGIEGIR